MSSSKKLSEVSKFLSFVLRHKPEAIGVELDRHGWVNVEKLVSSANASGHISNLDRFLIQEAVDASDKKRFAISEDGQSIRANQGHSISVDLQLKPVTPPEFLYHGTATRFLDGIVKEGLKPQSRQHVHLSTDVETAAAVGQRYGKPAILTIKALLMHKQGFMFYRSENDVWLVGEVPAVYMIIGFVNCKKLGCL